MRPLIAVTTYGCDADRQFRLPRDYVDAVRRAGGMPVLVPPGETAIEELLDGVSGLLLTGGGDVDPSRYGAEPHATVYNIDADRDSTEIALVQSAARRQLPTLGICRGVQVLNVALGGTLVQHLPDVVGESVLHRQPPRNPVEHLVVVAHCSKLATLLHSDGARSDIPKSAVPLDDGATGESRVVSWHHQSIDAAAPGLAVVARAPDGTVEAVESPARDCFIGVQWHPELSAATDAAQQRLFDALVASARRFQEQRRGTAH